MTVRITHINIGDAFRIGALLGFILSLFMGISYFTLAVGSFILRSGGRLIAFEATDCLTTVWIVLASTLIAGVGAALVASLYNLIAASLGGGLTVKLGRTKPDEPKSPQP